MSLCLPNHISAEQFLNEYWQKKPLFIKQGLSQLSTMFEPEDILGLALDEAATARLITQHSASCTTSSDPTDTQWRVKQSPLTESDFSNLPKQWTILVQNLEQWSPQLGQLWQAFDFIPQWQRDDIMVSYAPKGGSVGKHFDEYDVFLAQGYGTRRWQLGKYCSDDTEFLPNQPIKIFDDMGDIFFDEILEPGDVLYVPPKLAHYGVAQNDCLTFSFGFRRPNLMQVLDSLVDIATADPAFFKPLMLDQFLQPTGRLDATACTQIKDALLKTLQSKKGESLIGQAVAEVVSKRQYDLLVPEDNLSLGELNMLVQDGALIRPDHNIRLIYTENNNQLNIYVNGQQLDNIENAEAQMLKQLADGESIEAQSLVADNSLSLETLMQWLENGWVWLDY